MKSLLSFLFFLGLSGFLIAQDFEGTITMTSTEMGEDMELVFTVKGKQVLIEADTPDGKVVTLAEKGSENVTTLFDRQGKKFGLKMGAETMQMIEQQGGFTKTGGQKGKMDITVTKDTKNIDGYSCTKVIGKDDNIKVEGWITQDLGFTVMDLMPNFMQNAIAQEEGNDLQMEIMRKGFLLEGTEEDLKTGEKSSVKLVVNKQKVGDEVFSGFGDYKIYDMTNMMEMMGELQKDPEKMKEFEELMKLIQN